MRLLPLAVRMLRRDWRAGELRVLLGALVIAVASVTTVGFFTDRVRLGIAQQAGELLAADLVLESAEPVAADRQAAAVRHGLRRAAVVSFRTVALAGQGSELVELKAVASGYPLRGELRISPGFGQPARIAADIPPRGEVWVEPRLLGALGVAMGERVQLGEARLRLAALLRYEPDRGGELFSIGPRVMMNLADLPATALLQPGSRVSYRLLVAGQPADVQAYRRWLSARLQPGERLLDVREGRPELRIALTRAQQFLGLAALVSVLLAGVAVATAARRYARRHLDAAAMMRCLGASQATVVRLYALELAGLALLGALAGSLFGYVAQMGLDALLGRSLLAQLPAPSWQPLGLGLATAVITLGGFALPPLLALRRVPPLRVMRRMLGAENTIWDWWALALVLVLLAALLAPQVRDNALLGYVIAGSAGALIVLALGAHVLVRLLRGLRARVGVAWRYGLANITRRPGAALTQVVALGLGIMVLLLLSLVRTDLLEGWHRAVPPQAPNHFLINVQAEQVQPLRAFFAGHDVPPPTFYPMVRGRLVAINGRSVRAEDYEDARARRLATREFNLSWAAQPPGENRVVAGRWWGDQGRGRPLVSMEEGIAGTLGVQLGDVLTYRVAGEDIDVTVSNLRSVDWDSFRVNFFALLPPGVIEDRPASWITAVHLSRGQDALVTELVAAFPNVTVIDVQALMNRVREIIGQVSQAVQYLFLFTLAAGLAVLLAALQAHQDERRHEAALLRTLGASQGRLMRSLIAEFATLGAVAGVLAGAAATLIGALLGRYVLDLDVSPDPGVVLIGLVAGAAVVGAAGVLGTRSVVNRPPMETLRRT